MGHSAWMYRLGKDGIAESRLFDDSDTVPEGWSDSPEAAVLFKAPKDKAPGKAPKDKALE